MSKLRSIILLLVVLLLIFWTSVYFQDSLLKTYNNFGEKFQKLDKTDLGNLINEVRKEILAPTPLNIGGKANSVVLVKSEVIAETNLQRKNNGGLPALTENVQLNAAATVKAEDMFKNQYFEHISPSGLGPGDLVKNVGYEYVVTGENLILGNFTSEKEVVQLWMNSPGHRANILNNRFTEIGVAIIKGSYNGQTVWIGVQEFGLPLASCPNASVTLKNQIEENKNKLDQLALQIEVKRSEIESTNPRSENYNQLVDEYNALVAQYNPLNEQIKNIIAQYNTQVNNFNNCVAGE